MKLLLDANLSPRVGHGLAEVGYDVTHVAAVGLANAMDATIFDKALTDSYIVITCDSDFATLLAMRRTTSPSVVCYGILQRLRGPLTSSFWSQTFR